ncbi:MAG: tyrosine-type recombinase/integrase [Solibacillus sp.]|uniref:tyrosine-type recombinase/integrase n=1 Tax=Solibacillus sp. TaxID=1909654 RepID=UPI00331600F6
MQPSLTQKWFKKIVKKYKLKKLLPMDSDTHCTLLFEFGLTVKQVQDRLGHTDVQTTLNIYTHISKDS